MPISPLSDRLAVREHKPSEVSAGGIFIGVQVDDGLVKEMLHGEVVAVGPGMKLPNGRRDSMWGLKPGDVVSYSPVLSVKQMVDGEELTIIRRDAIAGTEQ